MTRKYINDRLNSALKKESSNSYSDEVLRESLEYIKELEEIVKDTRKFTNRLPSEWVPEHICALLEDKIGEVNG